MRQASLPGAPLPPGDYTVTAYFSGVVPLPSATLALTDERYEPSTASGSLTIAENAAPNCEAAYAVPAICGRRIRNFMPSLSWASQTRMAILSQ